MFIEKFLKIPVQRTHFVDGVHGMVGGAEFSQRGGAHQLEKAQAGLAVFLPFKVCILLGQNGVPGVSYGAVALDVGIQHTVQVCSVAPELFQVAVRLIAGEGRRHHKGRMAEQIVLHIRLIDDLVFGTAENLSDHFSIVDADGNVMPWQKSADGRLVFFAKGVPAKGYKTFRIVHGGESGENTVKVENKTIENKFFTVKFDKDMNIASLIHKATGRAVAPEGEVLNKIYAYDDRPFNHEAWDIKVYFDQKYTEINDVSAVDVTESGPVRTVIKVTRKFLSSTIEQSFIFYADLPRIDVDYTVDWKEKKILLKADFPVDVNATEATYDIQFGNYKRPTHRNTLWDFAQFEVVGHKWVDLSDNSFGLSVLNDCKYGHDIKDGHIRTSLLRCAVNPNSEQDREVHRFTYSIYPHAGSVDTSDVVNQGYSLNLPLYCVSGKAAHDSYSLVSTDKDNVIIETVKKAEDSDDVVIRAYETWNKTTDCVYTFDRAPKSIYVCNLLEENEEQLEVSGNTVSLRFKPFEIKTVKVTF